MPESVWAEILILNTKKMSKADFRNIIGLKHTDELT